MEGQALEKDTLLAKSQFGTPRKQGIWSKMIPAHSHAMRINKVTLSRGADGI
jgi:hypothetical protein